MIFLPWKQKFIKICGYISLSFSFMLEFVFIFLITINKSEVNTKSIKTPFFFFFFFSASRFEFWFLGSYRLMNPELKVATGYNGACYHIEELSRIWDRDFLEAVFSFSACLQKLNLEDDEIGLIRAIIIMSVGMFQEVSYFTLYNVMTYYSW